MRFRALLTAATFLGCGGAPTLPMGSVELRFSVSSAARTSQSLKDPLKGDAYGSIFLAEDVSLTGPRKGAKPVADIPKSPIDLQNVMTTETAVVVDKLEPNKYVFLGFFDLDSNPGTAGSEKPDTGDIVTLPRTNEFEIQANIQTKRLVIYDFNYSGETGP